MTLKNRIFDLSDLQATQKLAESLALHARIGDVLALKGDLGTGKTAFARFFIHACTTPAQEVPSPTFTLVQRYEGARFAIFHFDLYRLTSKEEVFELGIEEAFAEGVSLIEWPERLANMRLANRLTLEFSLSRHRSVALKPEGSWVARLKQ